MPTKIIQHIFLTMKNKKKNVEQSFVKMEKIIMIKIPETFKFDK